jgi:hypothetical protein
MKINNNVTEFAELRDLARGQIFTVNNYDSEYDQGLYLLVDVQEKDEECHYFFFDLENDQICEEVDGYLEVQVYRNAYITLQ